MQRFRGAACTVFLLIAPMATAETRVVLLGTGNPAPEADRSGPAVAVTVHEHVFLVDAGAGVMRQFTKALEKTRNYALDVRNVRDVFITHLHSDHTLGYPDVIFTTWIMGRYRPLEVYGPPGIKDMTAHLLKAYAEDIRMRTEGLERADGGGYQVNAHEIAPGVVYEKHGVKVTAIKVDHGSWEHAFGFRFDTPDRVVVISGDTAPSENLVEHAKGCDVLVHEVYSEGALDWISPSGRAYHTSFHTSGVELGKLAARIKPKLLVLYHKLAWSETEEVLDEVREHYDGEVVMGEDLDEY